MFRFWLEAKNPEKVLWAAGVREKGAFPCMKRKKVLGKFSQKKWQAGRLSRREGQANAF